MSAGEVLNGSNVNRVEFGDSQERKGTLQQVGRKLWVEDSVVAGERHFGYVELRRDDWSVYLHDSSRDVYLQIDLHTRELKYGSSAGAVVPIYELSDVSRRPDGRMVNRAEIGHGNTSSGTLRQVSETRWEELDGSGRPTFGFTERTRDDWSVYLHDASRDVHLQIDLHTSKVLYAVGAAARTPLYDVLKVTDDVTGWLVNLVEVGSGESVTSRLAQVSADQWVETDPDGAEWFRFAEAARDDWSVYLHDPGRDVHLQIDLFTRRVMYRVGSTEPTPLYDVLSATDDNVPPRPEPEVRTVKGPAVNRVEFGSSAAVAGVLRQVDLTTWVEDGAAAGGRDRFSFNERTRDEWSVYLHDPTRNVSIQIDLHRNQVLMGDGTTASGVLAEIRSASDEPNGWLTTEVRTAPEGADTAALRKVDWTTWVEVAPDGKERFEFVETARDDWSIYLHDASRDLSLQLDLYTKEVRFGTAAAQSVLYRIASGRADQGAWRLGERITSRSQLTQLYGAGTRPSGVAFRTALSFSANTRWVDVYATEEAVVTIRGEEHRIDRVRPVRVTPHLAGKLVVTVPVTGLSCPTLCLHTNLMKPGTVHLVTPDADVQKKVLKLPPGELQRRRTQLGVPDEVTSEQLDGAQQAVQDLVGGLQYAYNVTPTGVQHDRAVRPANLSRPALSLDLSGAHVVAASLDVATAAERVAAAVTVGPAQQAFLPFASLLKAGGDLLNVTVTTGLAIGDELIGGVVDLADEGGRTFDKVAERFVAGDFEDAERELTQGGENAGRILNKRGRNIGVAAETGARDALVLVAETARGELKRMEATVQDLLDLSREVIRQVGVAWDGFVDWLADAVDWGGVLETKRGIQDLMRQGLAQTKAQAPVLRAQLTLMMAQARTSLGDTSPAAPSNPPRSEEDPLSEGMAELDAFLDQVMSDLLGTKALDVFPNFPALEGTLASLTQLGQRTDAAVLTRVGSASDSLAEVIGSGSPDPAKVCSALIDVFRAVALSALDIVEDVGGLLLGAFEALLDALESLLELKLPLPVVGDLYSALTDGEKLTIGGLVALILAVPVHSAFRAATGKGPVFSASALTVASSPPKVGPLVDQGDKTLDILYAVCHGAMTLTSPAALVPGKDPVTRGLAAYFGLLNLGFTSVAYRCGVPKSREPWTRAQEDVAFPDLLQQPEYRARAIWTLQAVPLGFGVADWLVMLSAVKPDEPPLAAKVTHNTLAVATGLLGVVQMVWAVNLHDFDTQKYDVLDRVLPAPAPDDPQKVKTAFEKDKASPVQLPADGDDLIDWASGLYHYHQWANVESRRVGKLVENLSDALPTVATLATAGLTDKGAQLAMALSALGHLTECIAHGIRTGNNELY